MIHQRTFRPFARALAATTLLLAGAFAAAQGEDAGQPATTPAGDAAAGADPVVVRLGATRERLSELESRFEIAIRSLAASQGAELTPQVRAQLRAFMPNFLEQRATELVLLDEAAERGIVVEDAALDARVERIRSSVPEGGSFEELLTRAGFRDEAQLRTLLREQERIRGAVQAIQEDVALTEAEVRGAYAARRAELQVPEQACARHILVATQEEAEAVREELEGGADFATLAQERSTGPTGPRGGQLGCFGRGQMVAPFEEAAFGSEVGEPSAPVQTQFGWHVILVEERRPAGVVPFDEARPQLEQELRQERSDAIIDALVRSSGVRTYPDRLPGAQDDGTPDENEENGEGPAAGN